MTLIVLPTYEDTAEEYGGDPNDFMARAAWALAHTGWRQLGTIPGGEHFRESDIEYDAISGHYYVFSTSPADSGTVFRHAATLEGIAAASPVASGVGVGSWYPSVKKHENGDWYLFGTSGTGTIWGTSSGPPTGSVTLSAAPTFADAPAGQIDVDAQRVTISGTNYWYWIAVSVDLYNGRQLLRVYRHANSLITSPNTWTRLQGSNTDVFRDIGYPAYAADAIADPNLAFPANGRVYCLFTGRVSGVLTAAIVELAMTGTPAISGGFATGTPVVLSEAGNPSWAADALSDLSYLACPDGVDRIFGFRNNKWGCLELP